MKKLFLIFPVYTLLILILGCGSGIHTVNFYLQCDNDCNDNNAVVVKIYQLKNADKFRYASFESLMKNTEATIGDDLIPNSKYEKTLVPGETYRLKEIEIKNDALFLGVVGDFFSPAKDGWMQVIPIDSDLENLEIIIHKNSLSFQNKD